MLALHQSCLGHLIRRACEILLVAKRGAARFASGVKRVLQGAIELRDERDSGALDASAFARAREALEAELDWLLSWTPTYSANARFRKHLRAERPHLFTFLDVPGLEATNWPAEQAIRPAVIARKLSGCNRTDRGARAQERLMSVARTAVQRERGVIETFERAIVATRPIDVFAPA